VFGSARSSFQQSGRDVRESERVVELKHDADAVDNTGQGMVHELARCAPCFSYILPLDLFSLFLGESRSQMVGAR
jgi:hypothetical protein